MTLEELKNKKVTITMNKTFNLEDDLGLESLKYRLEDKECWNKSDDTIIEEIIEDYYSSWSDFEDLLEGQDFKVTIHD